MTSRRTPDAAAGGAVSEAFERVFAGSPSPHILITTDLVIAGVNSAYLRSVGRTREQLVGRDLFDAFPAPADSAHAESYHALVASFGRVIATGEADTLPAARYDVAIEDGDPDSPTRERWWVFITSPVRDEAGESGKVTHLLHRVEDITELTVGLTGQLREARLDTARVLETMAVGYLSFDRDYRLTYVNAEGERLVQRPRDQLVGQLLWDAFPGSREIGFGEAYERVLAGGPPETLEAYYPERDGWFEARVAAEPTGVGVYFLDITARIVAQRTLERTAQRLSLLAEVSAGLAGTLDATEAMQTLARTVVPQLADWCIISVDPGHGLLNVAAVHKSPQEQVHLTAYADAHLATRSAHSVVSTVMATGEPIATPVLDPAMLADRLPDPDVRALLARLGPTSGLAVPIRTRDRTLGVLALWQGEGSVPHDAEDTETALEIGRRAGLLIENASLYAGQRRLAEALQRALLTEPPQPDHLQIAVRYRPAAQEAQVGGDWYDAFVTADGSTCLVIGDVAGHDGEAAATMGQVRNLLRGVAYILAEAPAAVLRSLDRAMGDLAVGSLATAVLCRVEQTAGQSQAGIRRLRWSNAGHPPPLLIEPDGSARLLLTDADLLLGLDPSTPRADHVVDLSPGATLLLYTDGLVERRGASIDSGLEWLLAAAEELSGLPLDELCDALLNRVGEGVEDDVALLAMRAHDQCHPRPAEVPVAVPRSSGAWT